MIEHVVFRCQLLSVVAECRPCCSIFDFCRFLLVERDFLTLIISRFHFLSIFRYSCHQLQDAFFVCELMVLWLLRIFVLSGWILSHTFSVLLLNSHNIFRSCSLEDASSSTSSAHLRLVRQSQVYSHSFVSFAIVEYRPSVSIEEPC